jgi:prepilin-type N-terminal cleavage/methylation domain-containing protein
MSVTNKIATKAVTSSKQRGSTLVEILVAVAIIALVLTAVSAMISMSVKLAESNEKKQLALQKAEEALEFFRKERAITSWYAFSTPLEDGATYCVSSLPENVASLSAQLGACSDNDVMEAARYSFQRQAEVNFQSSNRLSVQIEMLWNDGTRAKNLLIEQGFENY